MRIFRIFGILILAGIVVSPAAMARTETVAAAEAAAIAGTATASNPSPPYRALRDESQGGLLAALKTGNASLTQEIIDKAKQSAPLSDDDWLKGSGYDFAIESNQQIGIRILAAFTGLSAPVLAANDKIVTTINAKASADQQQHALLDADGISYLFFLSEALGPKLGHAFLRAYESGKIAKAAALIKKSEVSTAEAKKSFNYPRPFLIEGNTIRLVRDIYVAQNGEPYTAAGGSFPSGHTNVGYTDALLLAEMLPERFLPLLARGAGYGYSRVVLGVHYPLDVIGSRMIAERNVAAYLGDARYHALFAEARDELRAALEKECGESLAACAGTAGDAKADPWAQPAMRRFYRFTMTYGLPRTGARYAAMRVPAGAENLLAPLRGGLTADRVRNILARTAWTSGYPLDSADPQYGFWQRLDLYDAALEVLKR